MADQSLPEIHAAITELIKWMREDATCREENSKRWGRFARGSFFGLLKGGPGFTLSQEELIRARTRRNDADELECVLNNPDEYLRRKTYLLSGLSTGAASVSLVYLSATATGATATEGGPQS